MILSSLTTVTNVKSRFRDKNLESHEFVIESAGLTDCSPIGGYDDSNFARSI